MSDAEFLHTPAPAGSEHTGEPGAFAAGSVSCEQRGGAAISPLEPIARRLREAEARQIPR